jgi:hypothetical protein
MPANSSRPRDRVCVHDRSGSLLFAIIMHTSLTMSTIVFGSNCKRDDKPPIRFICLNGTLDRNRVGLVRQSPCGATPDARG